MSNDDQGPRSKPRADDIPCPFLAAAYNSGDLVCDEDGMMTTQALEAALAYAGLAEGLRTTLARGAAKKSSSGDEHGLNLFELRGSAADHTGNTGIRDPEVDPTKLPTLLGFGENGRMYMRHFAKAANFFRQADPGLEGTATETVELTALLKVFGRDDEDGRLYLTDDDLRALWVEGRYPDGWTPRAEGSISQADLLGSAARMGLMRVEERAKKELKGAVKAVSGEVKERGQALAAAVKDLLT